MIHHQLLRQHYTAQYPDDQARNRYPILMLKVTVSPSSVDVNLTPDKTQVLLHDKVASKFNRNPKSVEYVACLLRHSRDPAWLVDDIINQILCNVKMFFCLTFRRLC